MRILITNDDGITAPGIMSLYEAAQGLGELHVVAPADVQSATGHGITFHRPVATRKHVVKKGDGTHGFDGYAVEGKPADCTKIAMFELVPKPIDLVLSGINSGANLGVNVIYSGTVAAAMEAAFMGIPSIAVSLHLGPKYDVNGYTPQWDHASRIARKVIDQILLGPLEPHTMLNVNIPILEDGSEPLGLRVVPISTSAIVDQYKTSDHESGDRVFHPGGGLKFHHYSADNDVDVIFQRYVTVTPLHFDLTQHKLLQHWKKRLEPR